MHRKHPSLYGAGHCHQVSRESFACYLHGTASQLRLHYHIQHREDFIPLETLTFPWFLPHSTSAHQHDACAHAETETETETCAHFISFQLQHWPSLWTSPRNICVFKWFRAKAREVLIHSRATSKTNQTEQRPGGSEHPDGEVSKQPLAVKKLTFTNTSWLFRLTWWYLRMAEHSSWSKWCLLAQEGQDVAVLQRTPPAQQRWPLHCPFYLSAWSVLQNQTENHGIQS